MKIKNKTYVVVAFLIGWASLAVAAASDVKTKNIWFINESGYHSGEIWVGSPLLDNYMKTTTKKVPVSMKDQVLLGTVTGTATRGPAIRYEMKGTFKAYSGVISWDSIKDLAANVLVTFKSGTFDRRLYVELSSF